MLHSTLLGVRELLKQRNFDKTHQGKEENNPARNARPRAQRRHTLRDGRRFYTLEGKSCTTYIGNSHTPKRKLRMKERPIESLKAGLRSGQKGEGNVPRTWPVPTRQKLRSSQIVFAKKFLFGHPIPPTVRGTLSNYGFYRCHRYRRA